MATTNNEKVKAEPKPVLNGATHAQPEAGPKAAEAPLSPELLAQIAAIKTRIQASVGEVVLAMLNLARYRNQSVADLMHLVVTPLRRDGGRRRWPRPSDQSYDQRHHLGRLCRGCRRAG